MAEEAQRGDKKGWLRELIRSIIKHFALSLDGYKKQQKMGNGPSRWAKKERLFHDLTRGLDPSYY